MGRNDYLEYPDGHVRRQVFDDVGRLLSRCYEYSGGPATRCYTATYDAVGNPLSMLDPEGEDVFEYDALDRLKKATRKDPNGTVLEVDEYEYNALGALKKNANVVLDDQRARLDGAGSAPSAMPATTGGQAITLDGAGRVTSLRGTTIGWGKGDTPLSVQEPIPAALEKYGIDGELRRVVKLRGSTAEFYFYEGLDRVATLDAAGNAKEGYLFDGIDHPIRIKVPATSTVAYYELDLAGNVRRLRNSGGADLGGYRYTAFGQTKEDTGTLVQPLRWKARWHSTLNGAEIYDVRARQWAPEVGAFLSIDEYKMHDKKATLWGWPRQSPVGWSDPTGHGPDSLCNGFFPFVPDAVIEALCGGDGDDDEDFNFGPDIDATPPPPPPGSPGGMCKEPDPEKERCKQENLNCIDRCEHLMGRESPWGPVRPNKKTGKRGRPRGGNNTQFAYKYCYDKCMEDAGCTGK